MLYSPVISIDFTNAGYCFTYCLGDCYNLVMRIQRHGDYSLWKTQTKTISNFTTWSQNSEPDVRFNSYREGRKRSWVSILMIDDTLIVSAEQTALISWDAVVQITQ